jgi:hypothetical protein
MEPMSRIDILQERMVKTMPLPEPREGVRFGRVRLCAAALAGNPIAFVQGLPVKGHEAQVENALEMMSLGAILERVDENPTDWDRDRSANWRFRGTTDTRPGANGVFLNQWGSVLQVPRYSNETDAHYATRIVNEVISPSTTNIGLAILIDRMLGISGTQVVEGASFLKGVRLNDGGRQGTGLTGGRLMGFGAFGASSLWNTFIVILPEAIPLGHTQREVEELVDRRRAAGTRLLSISLHGGGAIQPPGVLPIDATITCNTTEGPAGDFNDPTLLPYSAQVGIFSGCTYAWTISNGYLLTGKGTPRITFALGESMRDAVLSCTITNVLTGLFDTKMKTVNVLPYPRTASFATADIGRGAFASGSLEMASAFTITRFVVDQSVRVRLYETAAQRDTDLFRIIGDTPAPGHGILLEIVSTEQLRDFLLDPWARGHNGDTPQTKTVYYSIENTGPTHAPVNCNLVYIQEA